MCSVVWADSKDNWPFTPAFIQIYVNEAQAVLDRAISRGAKLVTQVSKFHGGFKLTRFKDPIQNIWWLYEPDPEGAAQQDSGSQQLRLARQEAVRGLSHHHESDARAQRTTSLIASRRKA
jgi:hypothetical protein